MEPIKQEIINNIFENGDKLITGPILQTVLIDMIDDVNVKDQEILSKTGSWDEAATQIPNLATKEEVTNLSESVARDLENVDLTGYATEAWVQDQGYLKEHQDISGLATKTELTEAQNNLQGNITSLSESVARDLANVDVDLTGYATETWVQSQGYLKEHQDLSDYATKVYVNEAKSTLESNLNNLSSSVSNDIQNKGEEVKTWVQNQGYLTEHQDISNLATKGELNEAKNNLQGNITSLSESVARDLANVSVPEGVATEAWVQSQDYASKSYVDNAVSSSSVDLTGYATETWVQSQGYLTEHQDISNLATKTELNSVSESIQTDITNLSESVANSAVWKKGEGGESIVQIVAGIPFYQPKATGNRAIATGHSTVASGDYSHAEGQGTKAEEVASHAEGEYNKASGYTSHAEGLRTTASRQASHAEGFNTIASNDFEHAQGRYNYTSSNQIFSIGTGNSDTDRRNAVSVLEVDNSGSYTGSFFVQNIGGYDGTNPLPGTNDLATVINGMSTGGGSSETLWKKGTGQDSIVLILTGDDEAKTPTATGTGSIAIGSQTTASGQWSHAEGGNTKASGSYSHAEGSWTQASGQASHAEGHNTKAEGSNSHVEGESTKASGICSHAEGYFTTSSGDYSHAEGNSTLTSNAYEHAQGRYNHSSENQIFSVGTGNSDTDRRNVVSVLEVSNNNSYTGSVFVQNVGGYDGTNPTPGTNDLATVINGLSSGGGSSETLWKKGEGTDSIVQILTGADEAYTPTATGKGAVAIGFETTASGQASHAEGSNTVASGDYSHAEGIYTTAFGQASHAEGDSTYAFGDYSHAEGYQTEAPNSYECALGMCNHSSEGQIFSVGAGEGDPYNPFDPKPITRRNAISVLAVPNSDTQINTASVFVQNVGGYDGTNPIPGTNDLATVINGMSTGGGIGTSTETWTFTLDDGSTVTKNIVMA